MEITETQKSALKEIIHWFINGKEKCYVLEGEAGTGKTFLLKHILEKLIKLVPCSPLITAPSNEAVRQLRLATYNDDFYYKTTFSALGFRFDTSLPDRPLVQFPEHARLDNYNLLVVDEYSMNSSVLQDALDKCYLKILYLGHKSQLPEVKKNLSILDKCIPYVCQKNFSTSFLEENMRNTGEIYQYSKRLEETIEDNYKPMLLFNPITDKKLKNYVRDGLDGFQEGVFKYISWTNRNALELNHFVRRELFGRRARLYEKTDKLLLTKPCTGFSRSLTEKSNSFKGTFLSTNTEMDVLLVRDKKVLGLLVYELLIDCSEGKFYIYIAKADDYLKYLQINYYPKNKNPKNFIQYHKILDVFAKVVYSYGITVYRSQGMTIDNVLLDVGNIAQTPNPYLRQRQLYVGASRAKDSLTTIR